MDTNSKRNLHLFSAFCAFGLVLCQTDIHLVCLPAVWELDSNVTLRCSVQKSSYPSKCVTSNSNSVMFRRSAEGGTFNTECQLSNILGGCSSSGGCNCTDTSKNTTHYIFDYTFTVSGNSAGFWDCSVPCFNGITPLTSSTYDCVNKKVLEFPKNATEGSKTKEDLVDEKKKSEDLTISLSVLVPVAVVIIVLLVVVIFRLLWKTLFSCVICVIVCVDNETKKKKLHTEKGKVANFVSEHFTMHCCCCCCCSWLGWCCLGRLKWRGKKGDGNDGGVEGGALASSEGCIMGCVWCLSSVQNVKVDVHDIEDNQVSVLITLTSPLSWYSEAEDMPEKVKEYIRTEILKERGREPCNTSKPSMHLGVGCIAGSPDPPNEPPADYNAEAPKAQTKYTGNGNGQPKKRKSDKEIPLSIVGRSSPPSETSGDEKTHMIPPTKERTLPVPPNQHEPTSTGLGKSASPRLNPLTQDHSKMTSVERNSGAFPRKLPSPGQLPLDPIPSGKKS